MNASSVPVSASVPPARFGTEAGPLENQPAAPQAAAAQLPNRMIRRRLKFSGGTSRMSWDRKATFSCVLEHLQRIMLVSGVAPLDQLHFVVMLQVRHARHLRRGFDIGVVNVAVKIDFLAKRDLQFVLEHPKKRTCLRSVGDQIGSHCGARGGDHPAILFTSANLCYRVLRTFAGYDCVPALFGEVSDRQVAADIARPYVRPGIDKGESGPCDTWNEARMPEDFLDETQI